MINLRERMLPTWQGSNAQPPDHQSNAYPTEVPRPAPNLLITSWAYIQLSHEVGLSGNASYLELLYMAENMSAALVP